MMKIAIIHDSFLALGGAEKVVATLAGALQAPVMTAGVAPEVMDYLEAQSIRVIDLGAPIRRGPSFLNQAHLISKFSKCLFPGGPYDAYVLSGSYALFAAPGHHPNLLYCYTPTRALYDLYDLVVQRQPNPVRRLFSRIWLAWWRRLAQEAVKHVDRVIAISRNTQERILKYWARESRVIYPPVETLRIKFAQSGDFWLSVNRFTPEKRIPLQVETFALLPEEKLKLVGSGWSGPAQAPDQPGGPNPPPNLEFLGALPQQQLDELYATCKGHIATALDEDFGITPVEAMAAGKPVVATDEGGYRETMTPETGFLVKADPQALAQAVREVSRDPLRFRKACEEQARLFSAQIFLSQMQEELESLAHQPGKRQL